MKPAPDSWGPPATRTGSRDNHGHRGSGGRSQEAAPTVRVIPIAVLKVLAGGLVLLGLMFFVAAILRGPMPEDLAGRVAYGLTFAAMLVAVNLGVQVWGIAVGRRPQVTPRDARYCAVGGIVTVISVVVLYSGLGEPSWAYQVVGFGGFAVAGAITIQYYRGRERHATEIAAAIAARTLVTPLGERVIRIGMPQETTSGWVTWWSVEGAPSGRILQPAMGPDSMTSLWAALAAAEAAATAAQIPRST